MQQPQHGKTPQVIDPYPCPTQSFIQNQPWKPYVIHTMLYMASFVVAQPFPQAQPPVDVQPPATARPRHILPMLVQQPVTSHNLPPQGQVNLHQQQYVKPQIQQLLHEKLSSGVDALEPWGVDDTKMECQLGEEAEHKSARANFEDQAYAGIGINVGKSSLEDENSSSPSMKFIRGSKEKPMKVDSDPSLATAPTFAGPADLGFILPKHKSKEDF
ncbi:hypothetical protein CDL15_Pgr000297 [Punica granatum]|uniref:Uncharacterized protein n=1 Tax=Punica granatum TaxID=22663 RepID=A0A218Y255_PUNGR|nr:hypothetical protein CDL15_Pgr000297 [Punica granatum]